MPIPFIPAVIGAITATTAAHGIKKGAQAKHDIDEAKKINSSSEDYAKEAENFIKMAKGKTNEAISNLGKEKIYILTTSINDFILYFEKIKNMELTSSEGIDELKNFNPSSESFKKLKSASYEAQQVAVNGLAAIGSGALLAYGTYSVVMSGLGGIIVTATTGTALSSLTGVAATNATLAWLGGGAISAGGFGMAGGTLVLGGLVIGPALAIGGSMFASQAKTALNNAYSNYDKARAFRVQAKNIGIVLKGICTRAEQLTDLLQQLNKYFIIQVRYLKEIVENYGVDWNSYSEKQKKEIYKCAQLAKTIKLILDTQLLKQDGTLEEITETVLNSGQEYLKGINNL